MIFITVLLPFQKFRWITRKSTRQHSGFHAFFATGLTLLVFTSTFKRFKFRYSTKIIDMKRLLILLIAVGLFSCKDKKENQKTENAVQVKAASTKTDTLSSKLDELKKLSALGMDDLKGYLPDDILGIRRTNFTFNSAMGYPLVQGDYEKNKSDIRMVVYDCSGAAGADWYNMNYWSRIKSDVSNENGYTKSIPFKSGKAIESVDKANKATTLVYMVNDRILVILTGRNVNTEEFRKAAEKINTKP